MENWLNKNVYGYEHLTPKEKEAIMHFSMLWSFFENYVLNTQASAGSIQKKMTDWSNSGRLLIDPFVSHHQYFCRRYVQNGTTNKLFDKLYLRRSDKAPLVQKVLLNSDSNAADVLTAMLIIVLRYRNNFFHGLKWEYGFKDQLANFNEANKFLAKVIELE